MQSVFIRSSSSRLNLVQNSTKQYSLSNRKVMQLAGRTAEQVDSARINMQGEKWADVEGYEGIYEVSSCGRVRHMPTTVITISSRGDVIDTKKREPYILKQCDNREHYKVVGLVKGKSVNAIAVHRLLAQAFLPRLPEQTEVHHKDRDRSNNSLDNLQWVTPEEHDNLHLDKPRKPK